MEERQIGKQGEGNRNNEEEEGGSDGEKRAAWRTKKGDREDQEEKRIGRAGHFFLLSTLPFPHSLHFFPEHRSLLSSTVFVLHFPALSPILSLALLPFFSHVRSHPFSALPFLASMP